MTAPALIELRYGFQRPIAWRILINCGIFFHRYLISSPNQIDDSLLCGDSPMERRNFKIDVQNNNLPFQS
jgi:hypothetical protein